MKDKEKSNPSTRKVQPDGDPKEGRVDYRARAEGKLREKGKKPIGGRFPDEAEKLIYQLQLHQVELEMQNQDLCAMREELQASRDRYADLYNSAPAGYFTLDEKGLIVDINRTGAEQLGAKKNQLLGKPFVLFLEERNRAPFFAHLTAVFESRSRQQCELKIKRARRKGAERKERSFYAGLESVYTETADGARCRTILNDVTERIEAEKVLREVNEVVHRKNIQLEESTRARNRFFSFISHELKTPLNGIVGFAYMLRNGKYGPLSADQNRVLLRLGVNAEEMVRLINNILDLARIETGKMEVMRLEIDILEMLERIAVPFEPFIEEKGLRFERSFAPGCPRTVPTDPEKIRSIVTNLLSNAVKFTREGVIRLTAEPLAGGGGIRLAVSDTGIGIAGKDFDRIFEEYERSGFVQENPVRYTGGSGLGLSIVKRMVSLLGGAVRVESTLGKGTTFTVELPETR